MPTAVRPGRARLQLRFPDGEVERHFLMSYRAAARPWIRMSILVALSTVLGFAIIDHWLLVGPRLARADVWRFGLQLPLVLIMLSLTGARLYPRWYQPAIQLAAPLFGVGSVFLAVDATPATLPLVAARLLLAAFFFYFMLGLSFKAALRTNLLLIAAYATAALLGKIAPTVAAYSLFLLFCANLIGGAGCYALEYANRVAFLERRRLAEVASHDGLTGLLNRAALEERARSLWQHARISGLPVSVMLMDIDHFKAYNDHYGHPAGDRCLKEVAAAIAAAARRRPLDVVARYGGEEIIAILVGSDRAEATEAAANVLRAVTELGIAHDGAGARSYLTVSVGVTTVAAGGKYAHDDAVLLADVALYSAKRRGRNAWWYHSEADEGGGAGDNPADASADGLLRDAV